MITKTIRYAHQLLKPIAARRNCKSSLSYSSLERRQVLTRIILPEITTNLETFQESIDNATVRINDDSDLVIRLQDATSNFVEVNLNFGYVQVNARRLELALEIDLDQHDRILVIGAGETDVLRVTGDGLRAQLHPERTWIKDESFRQRRGQEITVHGIGMENVEINDFITPFTGGLYSSNIVRMFGTDGADHLTMTSSNDVTMIGEGYSYRADSVRRLFAYAKGGENFASVIGARAIPSGDTDSNIFDRPPWHCATSESGIANCFPFQYSSGVDQFYAKDNFANLQNDLMDARFVDFGTTRVDLLSGVDNVHIQDSVNESTWYSVDGESLVGANRRFINSERITIDGTEIGNDQLLAPIVGDFEETETEATLAFVRDQTVPLPEEEKKFEDLGQVFPDNFYWKWTSFEEVFTQ